jgi:hypothetical protein
MLNATPGKEIEDEEEAGLLDNQRGANSSISGEELGSDIPLCGFLSVRFYKPVKFNFIFQIINFSLP